MCVRRRHVMFLCGLDFVLRKILLYQNIMPDVIFKRFPLWSVRDWKHIDSVIFSEKIQTKRTNKPRLNQLVYFPSNRVITYLSFPITVDVTGPIIVLARPVLQCKNRFKYHQTCFSDFNISLNNNRKTLLTFLGPTVSYIECESW